MNARAVAAALHALADALVAPDEAAEDPPAPPSAPKSAPRRRRRGATLGERLDKAPPAVVVPQYRMDAKRAMKRSGEIG